MHYISTYINARFYINYIQGICVPLKKSIEREDEAAEEKQTIATKDKRRNEKQIQITNTISSY